ncbi:MAG: hypothetical protein M1821_003963 [Bathelium mastoideum]|nr:MAG: hypothetical protein M1821_003963 [Bathelium mastoideum]
MGLFMGNYLHTPYGFECGTTPEVVTIWPSATDGGPVANALTGFGTGSAGSSNLDVTSDTGGPTISNITPPTGVATSLGSNPTGSSTSGTANPSSAGLTAGDIAGLAVGSFVGLALLVLIIIGSVFLYKRRHPRPPPVPSSQWGNSQLLDQPMSAPSSTGLSSWISSAPVDPHDSISQVGQPSSAQTSTQSTGPQPTPSFHQHPQGALPPAPSQFGSIPPYYNPSVTL